MRPRRVAIAAILVCGYAVVVTAVALVLFVELLTGTGHIGHQDLPPSGVFGVLLVSGLLLGFAAALCIGAFRLYRGRGSALMVVPLLVFMVLGLVGEVHDIAGTESLRSNVIGAVILVLAATPVAIASTRAARAWSHANRTITGDEPASSRSQPSFPWGWYAALVLSAAATGIGFGIAPRLGFGLACVTVLIMAGFVVWAFREGRRRHAAGYAIGLNEVQLRVRRSAKMGTIFAAFTVLTSAVAIATDEDQMPVWILVSAPALIVVGVGWLWILGWFALPRLRKKQANRPDGAIQPSSD